MWLNISFVLLDDLMSDLIPVISYRQTLDLKSHRLHLINAKWID